MKDPKGHGSNAGRGKGPLSGHPYHKKSDDELRFIAKDAAEAGKNAHEMGDHKGMSKYADQVNDAATVLGHRTRERRADFNKRFDAGGLSGGQPISHSKDAVVGSPKSGAVPIHDAHGSGYNEHGSRHGYNPHSTNEAIAAQNRSGRGKIGGREASMIHRLLKGR